MSALQEKELLFERGGEFTEEKFVEILQDAASMLEAQKVPYGFMGGIASSVFGRHRWTHDIDVIIRPEDAQKVLDAFADAGFETLPMYPDWLYKALKDGVLIDLIFRSSGNVYLDEEMYARTRVVDFQGVPLRMISPEDLLVLKALASEEHTARHWYDALGIISGAELDWEYLLRRARHGARRVLSLLIYADSEDLIVPRWAIAELAGRIYPKDEGDGR